MLSDCSCELSWLCSTAFAAVVASNLDRAIANAVNPRRSFSMLARGDLAIVWDFAAVASRLSLVSSGQAQSSMALNRLRSRNPRRPGAALLQFLFDGVVIHRSRFR